MAEEIEQGEVASVEATPVKAAPSIADMASTVLRRTIPYPSGSCNTRIGEGAIDVLGSAVASVIGHPERALLVSEEGVSAELTELVRRQLTDAGFEVEAASVGSGAGVRTLAAAQSLFVEFGAARLTSDDCIVGIGHVDSLSLLASAAGLWCQGATFVCVPLDTDAAIEVAATPRPLTLEDGTGAVGPSGYPRVLVFDPAWMDAPDTNASELGRSFMVAAAVADGEKSVVTLAERAEALLAGEAGATCEQVAETLRIRGRLSCSNSLVTRKSLLYGTTFSRALATLSPDLDAATCLSEALRFSARVAIGAVEGADVDLVFTQDALLDRLGLEEAAFSVEPDELISVLKAECFKTSNRFMIAVPEALGRVRLSNISEDVLAEHAEAFCTSRGRNLQKRNLT